jgi:hypothetical protein
MGVVTFLQLGDKEISFYIDYFENTLLQFVLLVFQIRQVREVNTLQQVQHNLSTERSKHNSPNGKAIRSFIIGTPDSPRKATAIPARFSHCVALYHNKMQLIFFEP